MNRVYSIKEKFVPIRSDRSRLIVSYNCQLEEDGIHAIWYEIYFYKKPHPYVSDDEIKIAILDDINSQTNKKILNGFVWKDKSVWLSSENQINFKAAYDLAVQTKGKILPMTFKIGETPEGEPVYHTFGDLSEFKDFYIKEIEFINACLNEGWKLKDSINWDLYKIN
jgi:hypothetical protein